MTIVRISQNGLDLIKRFEGLRLEAYQDVAGIWTIGYGHIGPDVHEGKEITDTEAELLLIQDLEEAEASVSRLTKLITLTQGQFDALVSFEFNTGGLASSTLLKKIRLHDFAGAFDEFMRWNHAGGVVVPGLTIRRKAEQEMFRS